MRLDHVQTAIPVGGEDKARSFFGELLGLSEIPRPQTLRGRASCWFEIGDQQIHVGVDPDFRPARNAHVAMVVEDFGGLRSKLEQAGHDIRADVPIDGRARFFTSDPFGNRIEFIEAS